MNKYNNVRRSSAIRFVNNIVCWVQMQDPPVFSGSRRDFHSAAAICLSVDSHSHGAQVYTMLEQLVKDDTITFAAELTYLMGQDFKNKKSRLEVSQPEDGL